MKIKYSEEEKQLFVKDTISGGRSDGPKLPVHVSNKARFHFRDLILFAGGDGFERPFMTSHSKAYIAMMSCIIYDYVEPIVALGSSGVVCNFKSGYRMLKKDKPSKKRKLIQKPLPKKGARTSATGYSQDADRHRGKRHPISEK